MYIHFFLEISSNYQALNTLYILLIPKSLCLDLTIPLNYKFKLLNYKNYSFMYLASTLRCLPQTQTRLKQNSCKPHNGSFFEMSEVA